MCFEIVFFLGNSYLDIKAFSTKIVFKTELINDIKFSIEKGTVLEGIIFFRTYNLHNGDRKCNESCYRTLFYNFYGQGMLKNLILLLH